MRKSYKREYEHHRRYDFEDYNTPTGKKTTKKRSHKRLRSLLNPRSHYLRIPIKEFCL